MNNLEIFTPEEREENEKRKRELIELVASRESVLIVGAGSSVRVGYVDWSRLLKELEDLAIAWGEDFVKDDRKRENDPLEYAEDIKSHIDKTGNLAKYHALLYDLFKPKTPSFDDLHKTLVALPFRGILTTNYDTVLEAALAEQEPLTAFDNSLVIDSRSAARVDEFFRAMIDSNLTRRIAHLHGKFEPPDSIILSIKDYERAYGLKLPINQVQKDRDFEWTLRRKFLWAVFATRRVVFIGFSMRDPYLNKMLETVSTDLWKWGQSTHIAIMSISPQNADTDKQEAELLKNKYGVDTVFYEDLDGSHLRLDHFVSEISKVCESERQSTIAPAINQPSARDRSEYEKPRPNESASQGVLNWLEQVNERLERGINDDEN